MDNTRGRELLWIGGIIGAVFLLGNVLQQLHPLVQDPQYHHFADTRSRWGVPNAKDVVSNAGMLLVGLAGLGWLAAQKNYKVLSGPAWTFFLGLIATAAGSSYYHLAPSNASLVWDRLPMAWTFAGTLSAVCLCASRRALDYMGQILILGGASATVAFWALTGNLWPYALLQFGGLALIVVLSAQKHILGRSGWHALIGWYALAKLLEACDTEVWRLTSHLVSGHTLKHLASAAAGLAFLRLLKAIRFSSSS